MHLGLNEINKKLRKYYEIPESKTYQKVFAFAKLLDYLEEYAEYRPKINKRKEYYPYSFWDNGVSVLATRSRGLKQLIHFCVQNPHYKIYKPRLMSLLRRELRLNAKEISKREIELQELKREEMRKYE